MSKPYSIIVGGVGGQGAITVAQLILGAAHMAGNYVLQSEIHGMSQRGGSVSAHILFSKEEQLSPTVTTGSCDLLIALEPLEALRYLEYLKHDAPVISSKDPIINMGNYPETEVVLETLSKVDGAMIIDTEVHAKELKHPKAGNMILLGLASKHIPIEKSIWHETIADRFKSKGEKIINKNIEAFNFGASL